MQSGLSVHRGQRHLPMVATQTELATVQEHTLVQARAARQSPRFQLAQRDRFLVFRAAVYRRALSDGHFVSMGQQFGLPRSRRNAASPTARPWRADSRKRRVAARRSRTQERRGHAGWLGSTVGARRTTNLRLAKHQSAIAEFG